MGKFTDSFFMFPIKVYDVYSLRKAQEFEEDVNLKSEGDWVMGHVRLPIEALESMTWQDGFTSTRSVEEVKEEGFDLTMVYVDLFGEFICTWPRKRFEEKLNEFMAKHETTEEDLNL